MPLDLAFVDVPVPDGQRGPLRFTFYWPEAGRWDGRDFTVVILPTP